jgi:hypothetical protein
MSFTEEERHMKSETRVWVLWCTACFLAGLSLPIWGLGLVSVFETLVVWLVT